MLRDGVSETDQTALKLIDRCIIVAFVNLVQVVDLQLVAVEAFRDGSAEGRNCRSSG